MTGRIFDKLIDAATAIGALATALMMIHVSLDVTLKYLFNAPIPATIVIVSQYYMLCVAFLPLALAEQQNSHISVEIFATHLPERIQNYLQGASFLFACIVYGMLTYIAAFNARREFEAGSFLIEQQVKIDVWPAYFILPTGTGLMTLYLALRFFRFLRGDDQLKSHEVPFE